MGSHKSKVLIELKNEDLEQLTRETYFNEKEIRAMYKRFWSYCSPDATVNKEQFCSMFNGGSDNDKAIIDHIFRTIDKNGNFELDFSEFITTVSVILRGTEVQKMMWVFHLFDENDDGTIEIEEMEHILEACHKKLDSNEVAALFSDMDINEDGKIDINEFTSGCRRNNILLKNVGLL